MDLKILWTELTTRYTDDLKRVDTCWLEIEKAYTSPARHYHNLSHLEYMMDKALQYKHRLTDRDTVMFSIYYHDIVYVITRGDNEEKSAALAQDRLTTLGVPPHQVQACHNQIIATKHHASQSDSDTNYLVDFDLAILGEPPAKYQEYTRKIRKEYSLYPPFLYNKGRKKVLQHFLAMERIFKTPEFYAACEEQARVNLEVELSRL